jgi:predicted metal-dependent hydrolase
VAAVYLATGAEDVRLAALATMGAALLVVVAALAWRSARTRSDLLVRGAWLSPPPGDAVQALRREDFRRHPVKNHFVNSLHIVVAHGEKYMIDNVKRVRDRLAPPHLRRQVDWFIEQEGRHAAEHRRFVAQLARLGYRTERLDRLCRFIGQRLLPRIFGARLNMAVTVAIEHWTASVAEIILGDRLLADLDPPARRLVEWHCFEELEHRAVAFDVYRGCGGGYLTRVAGVIVGFQLIAALSLVGLVSFLLQDRQLLSVSAWREGLGFFYTRQALVLRTLPRALQLLRPGFHPSESASMEFDAALLSHRR